ncbi:MAG: thioredoxin family protein [Caldilineaceae bacterium]|nr:thioredoxin family protein [Caldilineaceae bacterium]
MAPVTGFNDLADASGFAVAYPSSLAGNWSNDASGEPGDLALVETVVQDMAETYGIDKIPAVAVVREGDSPADYGVRLFGIPSGYEFGTLIEDIRLVSSGNPELSDATLAELAKLSSPVNIQVFVTPTCPYCPRAVLLAHRLAMASDFVTASMVEATEFPQLSNRYQVYGVPRTVINDVIHVEGAVPENMLITKLMNVKDDAFMEKARANFEGMLN